MKHLTNKEINMIAGGENNCTCPNTKWSNTPFEAESIEECRSICCSARYNNQPGSTNTFRFQGRTEQCLEN